VDSGGGPALGEALTGMGLPIAITCFVLAAAVRIIQGSATVACLTAGGLAGSGFFIIEQSRGLWGSPSVFIVRGSCVVCTLASA
ncbi:gluconate transporter, partial [Escherichia coli]|nr:gluconate transporter [Escherichia coli]